MHQSSESKVINQWWWLDYRVEQYPIANQIRHHRFSGVFHRNNRFLIIPTQNRSIGSVTPIQSRQILVRIPFGNIEEIDNTYYLARFEICHSEEISFMIGF